MGVNQSRRNREESAELCPVKGKFPVKLISLPLKEGKVAIEKIAQKVRQQNGRKAAVTKSNDPTQARQQATQIDAVAVSFWLL